MMTMIVGATDYIDLDRSTLRYKVEISEFGLDFCRLVYPQLQQGGTRKAFGMGFSLIALS